MIAIILSIIFPGLGQIYYGKTLRGILMIALALIPFLYPIALIWSIWDCVQLRKTAEVDPLTRKEAITAIVVFFVVIPVSSVLVFLGGIRAMEYVGTNYLKPRQTQEEMGQIMAAVTKYEMETGEAPESLGRIIGNRPLRRSWLTDDWGAPYTFKNLEKGYVLLSSGRDQIIDTEDDIEIFLPKQNPMQEAAGPIP